ncbi:MAG: hypothetical protein GX444_05955 [Myxococcales bacterium]|nr:hypothetical protein [Myxococcales bacterium]
MRKIFFFRLLDFLLLFSLLLLCFAFFGCEVSGSNADLVRGAATGGNADDHQNEVNAGDSGNGADDDDDPGNDHSNYCRVKNVSIQAIPEGNPLARRMLVATDNDCEISGRVVSDELPGEGLSSPAVSNSGTSHSFWFFGLAEKTTYWYEFFSPTDPDTVLARGRFNVPSLPEAVLRPTNVKVTRQATSDTWVAITLPYHDGYAALEILDREGRIRFFHPIQMPYPVISITNLLSSVADDRLVITNRNTLLLIDREGNEEAFATQLNSPLYVPLHHQSFLADDLSWGLILFNRPQSGWDCSLESPSDNVITDGVAEIDQNGNEVWRWSVADHPDEIPLDVPGEFCMENVWGVNTVDWTHANSVYPTDDGAAFIVSMRNLSRVIKVERGSGKILWQLGEGLDFQWSGPAAADHTWFRAQHDAQPLPDGHILLFDNDGPTTYNSRALELKIDEETHRVTTVWEFLTPYSPFTGSVHRLENGNTLISAGQANRLYEVNDEGQAVWTADFDYADCWIYAAHPFPAQWVEGD